MKKFKDLKSLYKLYGFNIEEDNKDYSIFNFNNGYFNNIEIIKYNKEFDCKEIKESYQQMGYACIEKNYSNIEEANERLFKGFFSVDITKKRLERIYLEFSKKQNNLLKSEYNYINCPYIINEKNNYKLKTNIIEYVLEILKKKGSYLIIIEASAGYGKTCTSYELLNEILETQDKLPIFTELSRNRTASIFKYILLDEIDRNFKLPKSEVVIREIKNGRIPLIIDGFDELVMRDSEVRTQNYEKIEEDKFDEVESMLDTIGDLLYDDSKVILTSRKSALFYGDKFEKWIENRENNFNVVRIILDEPEINDWLTSEKVEILRQNKVPINSISNPVVLSYLRNLEIEDFSKICKKIEDIIKYYFETLLERERERQNLLMSVEEQLEIFKGIAYFFTELNITSTDKEFLKLYIMEYHLTLLQNTKKQYLATDTQTVETLAYTLTNHVLLDRVNSKSDISFVNEFVFGFLLGDKFLEANTREDVVDLKYIDMIASSFSCRDSSKKKLMFNSLEKELKIMNAQEKIEIEIKLNNEMEANYENSNFEQVIFNNFQISKQFINCTFNQCLFKRIKILKSKFFQCLFFDCKFYDCEIIDDTVDEMNLYFNNCSSNTNNLDLLNSKNEIEMENESDKYERIILEKFWPKGVRYAQHKRKNTVLYKGMNMKEYNQIDLAIKSLREKELITKEGDYYILSYHRMNEIREILEKEIS